MNNKLQTLLTFSMVSLMLALPLGAYANETASPVVSADETKVQTLNADELAQIQMSCREGAIEAEIPADELELAVADCVHESSLIDPYVDEITESEGEGEMDEASFEDETFDEAEAGAGEAALAHDE